VSSKLFKNIDMKKNIQLLSLLLLFLVFGNTTTAQDFIFTEIPNPTDRYFDNNIAAFDEVAYLTYRDINYNRFFYTFSDEELIEIDLPDGYTYNWYITDHNGVLYITLYDINYNTFLFTYEDGVFTEIESNVEDENFGYYAFTYEDQVYVTFYNTTDFLYSLKVINGSTVEDVALPDGFNFGNDLGDINGNMYVTLNDPNWNSFLYAYNGSTFQEVELPAGTQSPYMITKTDDLMYITLYDLNFNSSLYTFDGITFTEVPLPEWALGVSFIGELNGGLYFRIDDANYQGILHELDGLNWIETPNPDNNYLSYGSGVSETNLYPVYYNNVNYYYSMGVFNGMDLTLVENPTGYTYSTYYASNEEGAFVSYYDPNYYPFLYYYGDDGVDGLIEVPIPTEQEALNYFEFQMEISDDQILFFSFRDIDYNYTLYWLGEPNESPTAQDNLVTTLMETPYSFVSEDFNFSDLDLDDTLTAIMIVEKPELGILHLNGANLATEQVIDVEDLEDLTYVPLNDGEGSPYDSFKFKVYDGDDFSEETYTMFINVVETITSVEDQELMAALDIYPNPATDFFKVDIGQYTPSENVRLYLYNNNGVAVRTVGLTQKETHFDVSDLPKGIYNMVIRTENSMFGRKILIQ
jgi:hypothetical protein